MCTPLIWFVPMVEQDELVSRISRKSIDLLKVTAAMFVLKNIIDSIHASA